MSSIYRAYCCFNLVSLIINFLVFILILLIKGLNKPNDYMIYTNISLQSLLIFCSILHYIQRYFFKRFRKSFSGLINKLFLFVPLCELLITINVEFRYYFIENNNMSWMLHLKLIYLTLKSLINSVKNFESLNNAYLINFLSGSILISNIWIIYGVENIEMALFLINQIFTAAFSMAILLIFLKKKFSQNKLLRSFINKMNDPIIIIEENKNKKQAKKLEIIYISQSALNLLDLDGVSKKNVSFEFLNDYYKEYILKKHLTEEIPSPDKSFKNISQIFHSLTEIVNYYDNNSLDKEKSSMNFVKNNLKETKESSQISNDLSLIIKNAKIQKKKYFFLKMKKKEGSMQKKRSFQKRLLTSISHELKTPLNGPLAMLEILKNEFEENTNNHNLMKNSIASLRLLENTLNNIIDQSLFLSNEFILCLSHVNIKEIMDQIYDITQSQIELKSLKFSIEIDGFLSVQTIYTDNTRLKQVILNILLNSIQFTNEGFINVKIKIISKAPLEIEFIIEDSGIGMKNEFRHQLSKKIEEEYDDFQANSTGSCMGLTITNKIIRLLGSEKIDINSDFGKGTIIKFRVKDLHNQNLDISDPKNIENIVISNDKRNLKINSIVFSSQLIDSRRKKNKIQRDPWNYHSESDNEVGSINVKTANFKLNHQKKHNFDTIKRQIIWNDSQKSIFTSTYNKTIFSKNKSSYSQSHTIKLSEKFGSSVISDLPPLEEKEEMIHNSSLQEMEMSSFSQRFLNKKKKSKLMSSSLPKRDSSFINKCCCEEILIVDDDTFNLLALEMTLKIFGYSCVKAMNGQEAINNFKIHFCNSPDCCGFKLIFMDYQMPVMDGVESTKEILKLKNIPIIGCTAFTTKEHITNCLDAGMKDVIFKPISKEIIRKILEEWIN